MSVVNGNIGFQSFKFFWKRPEAPPRLWSIFGGRRSLEDGTLSNFIIQEMPEEMIEEVLDHVIDHCFTEEMARFNVAGFPNDRLARQELRSFLKCWVLQGISIVALLLNTNPAVKPRLVGVSVLSVITAQDDATIRSRVEQFRSEPMRRMMPIGFELTKEVDVLEVFGVDKYLDSFGLSVLPSFRGQGLGEKMLRLREVIGRAYDIPASATLFIEPTYQALAERVGFEVLVERKYSELLDRQGRVAYPGVDIECIKFMAKRLY